MADRWLAPIEDARQEIADHLEAGNVAEAQRAHDRELELLTRQADEAKLPVEVKPGVPAVHQPAVATSTPLIHNPDTGEVFDASPADATELRAAEALLRRITYGETNAWWELTKRWPGADLAANLGFVQAMAARYPEIAELIDRSNLAGNVDMLEHVAKLGRQMAHPTNTSTARNPTMADQNDDAFIAEHDELSAIRQKIDEAKAVGDNKLANALYAREVAALERLHGSTPIVDGSRRTA